MNNTVTGNKITVDIYENGIINEGVNKVYGNFINDEIVVGFDLTDKLKVNNVLSESWGSLGSLRNR